MTAAVWGVLLLCCALPGDPVKPLTMAQFRELSLRAQAVTLGGSDPLQDVTQAELRRLGYDCEQAERIEALLSREAALQSYLARGEREQIHAVTRIEKEYPAKLCAALGVSCPPVLFYRGDPALFQKPCISVVGSREPRQDTLDFAGHVGKLIAGEGYLLCSGGAAGVDSAAQRECLASGGKALIFPSGSLLELPQQEQILYASESCYDAVFSVPRAMSRNRLIHAMGEKTFVCQPRDGIGGTWNGTVDNLRHGYSPVFVYDDGQASSRHLAERGAAAVGKVTSLSQAQPMQLSFT